jgi:Mg2+/Co2+ transporter CorB
MSRRFRPFYVAAAAVILVGIFGTEVVPKSQKTVVPEAVSVPSATATDSVSQWLGPLETPASGLLNLTNSFSVLPFTVGP